MLFPRFLPSLWGPLNKVYRGFTLRGCLQLRLSSYWSQHVNLTHSWWMPLILLPVMVTAFHFCLCVRAHMPAVWAFVPHCTSCSCSAAWIVIVMFVTSSGQSWNCRSPHPHINAVTLHERRLYRSIIQTPLIKYKAVNELSECVPCSTFASI